MTTILNNSAPPGAVEKALFMTIGDLPVCREVPSIYRYKDGNTYMKTGEFTHKRAFQEEGIWKSLGESVEFDATKSVEVIQLGEDYAIDPNINSKFAWTLVLVFILLAMAASFVFYNSNL